VLLTVVRTPACASRPEPVFGIIKSMGFRQFLLRGFDCVRGERGLVTMAWNIKRMYALSLG
jgi:Transposase DDE domain